ncbi:PQQ-dependent dehydrogenase, methanol/ethanol family [Novosphingobium flavum]|uniref:PQQ-dependent dehydrogenase, methanol/ethanol family n=1 Tax=Novosphingobium aerophilum TaxID=2839843 RepID=A0A7X1F6C6_9SPHN|nr:PQQ-dependent dehydrogenase, methanol/ethanol family [Novosphingobium aerophilum]MBC2651195.1 PQQ-dependent dehydrogenase, methanol/ethanol family [Novosphingobium aerophilum]MBC2660752.1 PQQ-dependent dehydrogenase, methanol/ethanol family [Novosphingobium aerophilum]
MSRRTRFLAGVLALALTAAGCRPAAPPAQQAIAADNWTNPGGDAGKTHHSALTDITPANVATLGLAWQADLGTNRVLEATPVVVDGKMYTSGVAGRAYAYDAATGQELWRFEPTIEMQVNRTVCCDMANRGVAVANGKVYVATLDAQLYALDAKTGKVVWQADTREDKARGISSTGAPEVAGNVVLIGNGGAEYGVRGYVSAFDLATGKLVWRFHTVPRDPKLGPQDHPDLEAALPTWDRASRWDLGGGGTPWDAINYDPETGLVLIGTGNGGPYAIAQRSPTGGTNLYLSSLVALDAKSGRVKWHYQETPGDSWDFTATAPMILTRLSIDGQDRPVVLHAPKNGYLYVIDRRDGTLLRANPIVRVNWSRGIDPKTGVPIIDRAAADFTAGPKIIFPGTPGARNWFPASYDPASGLYIGSVLDMGNLMFVQPGPLRPRPRSLNTGAALIFTPQLAEALPTLPPALAGMVKALPAWREVLANPGTSEMRAIDPLTGRTVWTQPMAGWQDRGGTLTTGSGLLVHGTLAGQLVVRESRTGKVLKTIETGSSILAAPMTYRVNGVQYIAVMAAWGGGGFPYVPRYAAAYQRANLGRLLVFKLGGGPVSPPPALPPLEVAPPPPAQAPGVTPMTIAAGRGLFFGNCAICHSNQHRAITPDLRRMQPGTHEAFTEIVLKGLLLQGGMPRWDDVLSPADAAAIHAYLIDAQAKTRAEELEKRKRGLPLDAPSLAILSNY